MTFDLKSLVRSKSRVEPPIILVHGVAGIGKTTLASQFPNPIFAWTEKGAGVLDVVGTPILTTYDDMIDVLSSLYSEDHEFKTLVVDSVDWFEPLVWAKACELNKWNTIEDPGYGKGFAAALELWKQYLDGLSALRDQKGMTIVQIAHTDIRRHDPPESEPYDRYVLKLHKGASAKLMEHADCIFFANYRISTVKSDVGFKKTVTRAVGSGERVLHTVERPAFIAKNRYSMPDSLPLAFEPLAEYLPGLAVPVNA